MWYGILTGSDPLDTEKMSLESVIGIDYVSGRPRGDTTSPEGGRAQRETLVRVDVAGCVDLGTGGYDVRSRVSDHSLRSSTPGARLREIPPRENRVDRCVCIDGTRTRDKPPPPMSDVRRPLV